MTVYCGIDFHTRQQTVCYSDTTDGAVRFAELDHEGDHVRNFYSRLTGEVIVGIEASGDGCVAGITLRREGSLGLSHSSGDPEEARTGMPFPKLASPFTYLARHLLPSTPSLIFVKLPAASTLSNSPSEFFHHYEIRPYQRTQSWLSTCLRI